MKKTIAAFSSVLAFAAGAEDIEVTTLFRKDIDTGDKLVSVAAEDVTTLPDVGNRIFHFDAKETSAWTFADDAGTQVVKVPSLVGDRYAHCKDDGGGGSWKAPGWPLSPVLVNDPTLGNQPCLDFGEFESCRGLVFNKVLLNAGDTAPSNLLENVGTVFLVFNSEKGGGAGLLGGGYKYYGTKYSANIWKRNTSIVDSGTWNFKLPSSPLARWYQGGLHDCAHPDFYSGAVRQDGVATYPSAAGLSGGWQVLTIVPTGLLNASGFAVGPIHDGSNTGFSGGQRIAEAIIYDSILDTESIVKVENHLRRKWFGPVPAWDRGASRVEFVRGARKESLGLLTNGAVIGAEVADSETMEIGKLTGGRGGFPAFVKSGDGELTLEDASSYQGTVRLAGGTLKTPRKEVPSSLPDGVIVHFDSSDTDSIEFAEENGTNFVVRWESTADTELKYKEDGTERGGVDAVPRLNSAYTHDFRPWVNTNSFGGTRWTVDFGFLKHYWGPCLKLVRKGTETDFPVKGVTTALVVANVQSLGGFLLGGNPNASTSASFFDPSDESPYGYNNWKAWRLSDKVQTGSAYGPASTMAGTNTAVYINGIRRDGASGTDGTGYMTPGWQVVALKGAGSRISSLGGLWSVYYGGGGELAEVVMYHRPLSEEEIKDASAYLSKKWFGRETPGYSASKARGGIADIPKLETVAASTVDVPEGSVLRIDSLSAAAKLTKTGKGTLEVVSVTGGENIIVEEGEVKSVARKVHEGECVPAADPAAWFDANDIIGAWCTSNDGKRVSFWHDKNGRNVAWNPVVANDEWRPELKENVLNGMPVVDFGKWGAAKYLRFGTPLDGVRSVFAVGDYYENAPLLGNYSDNGFNNIHFRDFARNNAAGQSILAVNDLNYHVYMGKLFVDGEKVNENWCPTSNVFNLVECHMPMGAHGSAFSYQQLNSSQGQRNGARLAEVIVYERELTEREKTATRNYLMRKWFNAEPAPLPDEPAVETISVGATEVDGECAIAAAGDVDYERLTGEGTVKKTGAGTLGIGNLDAFTGTVAVVEGGLRLDLTAPSTSDIVPSMSTDGLIARFAADELLVAAVDETGAEKVLGWTNTVDDTIHAVGFDRGAVYRVPDGLNGKPVVKMDPSISYKNANFMMFKNADGDYAFIDGIKSVLWVIGSHDGGGYLLAGGTNSVSASQHYNFHRGGTEAGKYASEPLLGAAHSHVQSADWAINGKTVNPKTAGLSGGWDIVSMVVSDDSHYTCAEGFAADGRTISKPLDYSMRAGRQRLAEVLFYNRRLSESELRATEAYLSRKWNVNVPVASEENDLTVLLSDGSTLEMGELPHLAGLGGAGTVTGDVAPGRLVADFAVEGFIDVAGTFTIAPGMEIEVRNVAEAPADSTWVRILDADEFAGIGNLAGCTVTGETLPKGKKLSVRIREGGIYVKCGNIGSAIVIR